ncbi:hypothetical protein [Shinella kummerowiae]|uniref:hypothetical protein n=1 Tax=Shinella kummerowiae TaxID=417745 RepID=UPI0021B63B8C|nr:hypothetical protein [Shinella kummerowiae]MCT7667640.1 hypothetical protein [Shinella kummerowiae]
MNVTRQEALDFLDIATRNWPEMLPLSEDDIGDVATALLIFLSKRGPEYLEHAAKISEDFAASRPLVETRPSGLVRGRYEGEQGACAEVARLIRTASKAKGSGHVE